jgi:hypothetical protein
VEHAADGHFDGTCAASPPSARKVNGSRRGKVLMSEMEDDTEDLREEDAGIKDEGGKEDTEVPKGLLMLRPSCGRSQHRAAVKALTEILGAFDHCRIKIVEGEEEMPRNLDRMIHKRAFQELVELEFGEDIVEKLVLLNAMNPWVIRLT